MPALSHLTVAALTAVGVALRLAVAAQSVFADEVSTHWIVADHGLADVISIVHTDSEITPPLYFVAAWVTTRIGLAPELLRAPSLLAGAAAIPLVYALGRRTVGPAAALVATALTAFSPFMTYYSAEARGYELMIVLVLLSTLAMLAAVDNRRARWWIAYGACSCAAVYTHYTSVFALAGQLLWLLWAHPEARRAALAANVGAAVAFLPWLSGLRGDLGSTTTDILSELQPFNVEYVRISLSHWAIGYPYATPVSRIRDLPGVPALGLLAFALAAATAARLREGLWRPRLDPRLLLVIVLAVSVPAGEAVASAIGSNLLGTRNLAASWPAFALCLSAFLVAAGSRLSIAAAVAAIAAFAIAGAKLLDPGFRRPDFQAVAAVIDRSAAAGDVVVDGAPLGPQGVITPLDATLDRGHRMFYLGRGEVLYDPFRILSLAPPTAEVIEQAVGAAAGRRVFLVLAGNSPEYEQALAALPAAYRRVRTHSFAGIVPLDLFVFERRQTASGA